MESNLTLTILIIDGSIGLGIKYKVVNRSEMLDEKAYQVPPSIQMRIMKQAEQGIT